MSKREAAMLATVLEIPEWLEAQNWNAPLTVRGFLLSSTRAVVSLPMPGIRGVMVPSSATLEMLRAMTHVPAIWGNEALVKASGEENPSREAMEATRASEAANVSTRPAGANGATLRAEMMGCSRTWSIPP